LEYFKSTYGNKSFTLSHCWIFLKDTKKWETSYTLWKKLKDGKKGNSNLSTDGTIDLKYDGQCFGKPSTDEAGGGGHAKRPVGNKATKINMNPQASSLAFQDTLRELMVKKEETIAERGETTQRERDSHKKIC
jgi:hypothetical protein